MNIPEPPVIIAGGMSGLTVSMHADAPWILVASHLKHCWLCCCGSGVRFARKTRWLWDCGLFVLPLIIKSINVLLERDPTWGRL